MFSALRIYRANSSGLKTQTGPQLRFITCTRFYTSLAAREIAAATRGSYTRRKPSAVPLLSRAYASRAKSSQTLTTPPSRRTTNKDPQSELNPADGSDSSTNSREAVGKVLASKPKKKRRARKATKNVVKSGWESWFQEDPTKKRPGWKTALYSMVLAVGGSSYAVAQSVVHIIFFLPHEALILNLPVSFL